MQMHLILIYLAIILMREKQLQECLVIIVLAQSICWIHSIPHSLLKVCQV